MAIFWQANAPRWHIYAALRHLLLNSAGDKYHPMAYIDQINDIKQEQFEAKTIALKLNQLFALCKKS